MKMLSNLAPGRPLRLVAPVLFALAAACAGAAVSEPAIDTDRLVTAEPGGEITLAPGETARVPAANLTLHFDRVTSDSRCPTKALAQCVWVGSVQVLVQAGPITGAQYVEKRQLETVAGRDTTRIGGQLVRLLRVLPEKETLDSIPAAQYRAVFRVGDAR